VPGPRSSNPRAVVVGGGVLGTMHALEACRRGWEVIHLEADAGPRRASVRNFGLVWVSGRSTDELPTALRARRRWEEIAASVPALSFRPAGSITVARSPGELAVLAEAASRPDAGARAFELLDPRRVRECNPAVLGEVAGGLLCGLDAIVEPTRVLGDLRDALATGGVSGDGTPPGRYEWLPGRQVVDAVPTPGGARVVDHRGTGYDGDVVVLCPGDRLSGLGGAVGEVLARAPVHRCRLQMLQTAPAETRLTTALADGDSLRYYPAFDLPARAGLPAPTPTTEAWGMQLLLVQRLDGGLTIGDTHTYDEPFDFAVEEHPYDDLRARAERVLGWDLPPTVRRWAGVYTARTDGGLCFRAQADDRVWVVTAPAGRGMTLSPALAETTWEEIDP
jgi:FAD dependent oxidoreductase TIGR03364